MFALVLQRLLCHRVAQYYGLDTSTIDEGEDQGKILARRTAITAIRGVGLAAGLFCVGCSRSTLSVDVVLA